jgi:hypothetical protein
MPVTKISQKNKKFFFDGFVFCNRLLRDFSTSRATIARVGRGNSVMAVTGVWGGLRGRGGDQGVRKRLRLARLSGTGLQGLQWVRWDEVLTR